MKWVTRKTMRVNRAATCWLVKRFVDRDAEFVFVEADQVAALQASEQAIGFDAPNATYPHRDGQGRIAFEALVEQHCSGDLALRAMARIIHAADVAGEGASVPEAAGLRAISMGFPLVARDDHETVERSAFLYDALYAQLAKTTKPAK